MSNPRLHNPHDRFFKELFGRTDTALGFLKEYLPAPVYGLMDTATLEPMKESFVDKELSQHFSDILYRVSMNKKQAFLYLLFEHKSYVDPLVTFQLLRNMVKIWESYLKENKRSRRLPVVIPLVLYHGKTKWNVEPGFSSLFEHESSLMRYIPEFATEVYDISHLPDEAIRGEILTRAVLLLLKYIQRPDLIDEIPSILGLLTDIAVAREKLDYIEIFLRYLSATVPAGKKEAFTHKVTKTLKQGGDVMPSVAELWLQEGMEKGREKGREEGREQEIREIVLRASTMSIDRETIAKIAGISAAQVASILNTDQNTLREPHAGYETGKRKRRKRKA